MRYKNKLRSQIKKNGLAAIATKPKATKAENAVVPILKFTVHSLKFFKSGFLF